MIEAHEVDFWDRDPEQLELMEKRRMYPPHFTVCVTGSSATGPSSLQVKFVGSRQKLNTEIMLPYVRREGIIIMGGYYLMWEKRACSLLKCNQICFSNIHMQV